MWAEWPDQQGNSLFQSRGSSLSLLRVFGGLYAADPSGSPSGSACAERVGAKDLLAETQEQNQLLSFESVAACQRLLPIRTLSFSFWKFLSGLLQTKGKADRNKVTFAELEGLFLNLLSRAHQLPFPGTCLGEGLNPRQRWPCFMQPWVPVLVRVSACMMHGHMADRW